MPIGINLYAPNANVYRKPDGTPWPLARDKGEMLVTRRGLHTPGSRDRGVWRPI
ncbi:MAG: hypothetical protein ROO76_01920 [Terriglobia bacterium]|nr:hypothetical protein [Terriglobia bacterium]